MKRIIILTMILVTIASVARGEDEKIGPYYAKTVRDGCRNLAKYTPAPQTEVHLAEKKAMIQQAPPMFVSKYGAYDVMLNKRFGGITFSSAGNYSNLIAAAYEFAAVADTSDVIKFAGVLAKPLLTLDPGKKNFFSFYTTLTAIAGDGGPASTDLRFATQVMFALKIYDLAHVHPEEKTQALIAAMFSGDANKALSIVRQDPMDASYIKNFCRDFADVPY